MKVNRDYRFVLTNIPNSMLETGEVRIDNEEITGERMFASECHYYAEKNILECIKDAAKRDDLRGGGYYEHVYCIYKEGKSKKETVEREEEEDGGGKKIIETREIPGKAMLVEVITIDENGINIR